MASDSEPEPHKDGTGTDDAGLPDVVSYADDEFDASREVQTVDPEGGDAGTTFTLTLAGQTTGAIAKDASAATVQTALEALSNVAPGDVVVSGPAGGPYTIEFLEAGAFGDLDVADITGDGVGVNEVQTLTITGSPTGGTFKLQETISGAEEKTAEIAYNANAAAVDAALEALAAIPAGGVTCGGGALPGTPVTIAFTGALAEADQPALVVTDEALTGGTSPDVSLATTTPGATGPTVLVVADVHGS